MLVIETTANTRKGSEKNIMSRRASHHSNKVYLHTDPSHYYIYAQAVNAAFIPHSHWCRRQQALILLHSLFQQLSTVRLLWMWEKSFLHTHTHTHTHTPVAKVSSHMMNLFGAYWLIVWFVSIVWLNTCRKRLGIWQIYCQVLIWEVELRPVSHYMQK